MNVLVISSLYPSAHDPLSGIFVGAQVQELVKGGCQVKVVSPKPLAPFPLNFLSKKWAGFHATPDYAARENHEVYYPRYLSLPRNWLFDKSGERMFRGIKGVIREVAKEFPIDLIQAHVALPDGYAAMRVAEELRTPFVVTIHGADLQRTVHFNRLCKDAIAEVISHSSGVVLVSNKLKDLAEKYFGKDDKFKVIANGIDPTSISTLSQGEHPENREHKTILSVSNLIPTKGVDLNLFAVQRLLGKYPNLKYRVIGDGPERENLERLSRKLSLSSQVEFLGQLPREGVMRSMAECDIFSLPSWQEGFGIVYLEAMAHGKPVIGCLGEGIEDFVINEQTGFLVKPQDLESLVETLADLLRDPQKGIETGKKAQEYVLENFTWERNAQRTIQLYQEIIKD